MPVEHIFKGEGEGGNFKLDASVDGQPVKFLQNGGTRISISFACDNTLEGPSSPGKSLTGLRSQSCSRSD